MQRCWSRYASLYFSTTRKDRWKYGFHSRAKNVCPLFVEDTIIGSAGTCNLSRITRTSTTCRDYVRRLYSTPSCDTYVRSSNDRHVRSDSQLTKNTTSNDVAYACNVDTRANSSLRSLLLDLSFATREPAPILASCPRVLSSTRVFYVQHV